jgi:hypothetical protein
VTSRADETSETQIGGDGNSIAMCLRESAGDDIGCGEPGEFLPAAQGLAATWQRQIELSEARRVGSTPSCLRCHERVSLR